MDAHSDRSAGLTTLPKNAVLSDVAGDGDYRLVLIDLKLENNVRSRLKVYKGTVLSSDQTLPDIPCGIISFYTENGEFNVPGKFLQQEIFHTKVFVWLHIYVILILL